MVYTSTCEAANLSAGGYIPAIDHAVPPEVSLDNWLFFLELVRAEGERAFRG
jgi:hypothetical protein